MCLPIPSWHCYNFTNIFTRLFIRENWLNFLLLSSLSGHSLLFLLKYQGTFSYSIDCVTFFQYFVKYVKLLDYTQCLYYIDIKKIIQYSFDLCFHQTDVMVGLFRDRRIVLACGMTWAWTTSVSISTVKMQRWPKKPCRYSRRFDKQCFNHIIHANSVDDLVMTFAVVTRFY